MKKKFLALALVLALSLSGTMSGIAAPSTGGSTNSSTSRGGSSGGGGGSSSAGAHGVEATYAASTYAASTSNGTTTVTADGATKTSETKEINLDGVNAIYESGTVKGAGIDIELQSVTTTVNGVTYTAVINRGTIDDKAVAFKIQFVTVNGTTVGVVLDGDTNLPTNYTGDLTIVIPEGSKKLVHVTNGTFVL